MRHAWRCLCFALTLLLGLWAGGVPAQETGTAAPAEDAATTETPDVADALSTEQSYQYDQWIARADAAQVVIDDPNSSNAVLQTTRENLASYRDRFAELRSDNAEQIKTLQSQLATLGPVPEDGTEPAQVAEIRARLTGELNALRVPVILAEESRIRANGMIQEIDAILNDRLRLRLLRRDPLPLRPSNIDSAVSDLLRTRFIVSETRAMLATPSVQDGLVQRGPLIVAMLAISFALIGFSRRLSARIQARLGQVIPRGEFLLGYVRRFLRLALPFMGILLLASTLRYSGIFGLRTELVIDSLPKWGALLLGFNWLAYALFGRRDGRAIFAVSMAVAAQMTIVATGSALMLILMDFITLYESVEVIGQATLSVLRYPLIALQALFLMRVQHIVFRSERTSETLTDLSASFPLLRRAVTFLMLLSCVAGAVGYVELASWLVFSMTYTALVMGVILVLQQAAAEIWRIFLRTDEGNRDQLLSAVTAILLWVGALPIFAIIWGARPAQLGELWTRFLQGGSIGGTQISPTVLVTLVVIFGLGVLATRLMQATMANQILPKTRIDPGGQAAIVSGMGYVGYAVAGLVAVTGAGLDLSSLAIVAGALSVGIGFGLQTIVSNFVSGIILLIERPVSKGDWISVGSNMGYVRDISVRSTRIETFDRTDVIVPNSDLISGTVVNYTRGNTVGRVIAPVGVAYGTDTRKVEKILMEIANAHPMVLANPGPAVVFQGFGADSLDFEIRAILRDVNWVLTVKSDMNHEIARRFAEEGIEIPFAQRDVWLRNPEVLSQTPPAAPAAAPDPAPSQHLEPEDFALEQAPDAEPDGDGPR